MSYYTDEELAAATDTVVANVLAPLNLKGIAYFVAKDVLHGFFQRQCANALTAAAKIRGLR
jgi:hypothetical protein